MLFYILHENDLNKIAYFLEVNILIVKLPLFSV
jgi:hypothetical protein